MSLIKFFFTFFLILFFTSCSSDNYSKVSVSELVDNILLCSSTTCIEYGQKLGKNKEFDSHKRRRYTELDGNAISIYWEPFQYDAMRLLAIRVQNKDQDKWYAPNSTEIGFFKAIIIQAYGNTFSNTILGPVMGLFAKSSLPNVGNSNSERYIGYWKAPKGRLFHIFRERGVDYVVKNENEKFSARMVNDSLKGKNSANMEFSIFVKDDFAYYSFDGVVIAYQRITKEEYDSFYAE